MEIWILIVVASLIILRIGYIQFLYRAGIVAFYNSYKNIPEALVIEISNTKTFLNSDQSPLLEMNKFQRIREKRRLNLSIKVMEGALKKIEKDILEDKCDLEA